MTARIYSRVSSADQVLGFSLQAQRAKCEAWAAFQGIRDVQHYEDAGISGKRDDRPGLTTLLLDLQPGDVVVAYALSRLARGGAVQLLGIVRDIRAKEARVVFITENIDTDTPTGRLMLTILAALAELEIEQTKERTDMGRTQAAIEGIYPHSPESLPTGWTTNEKGRIVEHPDFAETVRLVMGQGTATYNSTAQMLNAQGIPSPRGGKWTVVQVRRIVRFEGYATGQMVYRAATRPSEPEQHVVIPAPALVSLEMWQAAQRDGRVNNVHKRPDKYPLTGHLRCACGARLAGRHSFPPADKAHHVRHAQYVCFPHVRKTPTCPTNGKGIRTYRVDRLNAAARKALAALLSDPSDPAHVAAAYGAVPAPDPHSGERQGIGRKLAALLDLYLEQVIDRATYDARRATLTARLASLTSPATPAPATMPPRSDLALDVLECDNLGLAELLDLLEVEMVATGDDVRIVGFRPIEGG